MNMVCIMVSKSEILWVSVIETCNTDQKSAVLKKQGLLSVRDFGHD